MEYQETVTPESEVEVSSESLAENPTEAQEVMQEEEQKVPLHALQKERRKRQDLEHEIRLYKEQQEKAAEDEDESRYESATKADLGKNKYETKFELKREIQEESWALENPEKYQKINVELPVFLKLRPNLAPAIEGATNRYKEAWELMSALSPKQKQQLSQKPKPQAPGSPSGIPKAASLNESVDMMRMTDSEFNAWRNQKRGKR